MFSVRVVSIVFMRKILLFSSQVGDGAVAFSGPVIFTDLWNFKSVHKTLPQLHPHPVAKHHLEAVLRLVLRHRGGVEVASQLSDILSTLGGVIAEREVLRGGGRLTVTLWVTQSFQNWLAENFFLATVPTPSVKAQPVTISPAAVWYIGRAE